MTWEAIEERMDELGREFVESHDPEIRAETYRLAASSLSWITEAHRGENKRPGKPGLYAARSSLNTSNPRV
jgi:hypothetical protein